MEVSLWAEIRRLHHIERLSRRAIAGRLHCAPRTVKKALCLEQPPSQSRKRHGSILDPYHAQIDALIANYPELSAVRVLEEISKGADGYRGEVSLVRRYLRRIRPARGRVYQEVHYDPGEAMQVDWGDCGRVYIGQTQRRVSVFVAVFCFSRLCYIKFTLCQRKAEFYRAVVDALGFFGGSPRKIIFDNLKAAVQTGWGPHACLHPEFLALCGHFCIEPIACQRRDPESKGVVEGAVRYVKHNALQGRAELLKSWDDYLRFAPYWRDQVANVRIHQSTKERPVDRFEKERAHLRALPSIPFDSDELVAAVVTPHARVNYDSNRYSVPPEFARKPVSLRINDTQLSVLYEGKQIARHRRCYEKRRVLCLPEHQLDALKMRKRTRAKQLENDFDSLGPEAKAFHLKLLQSPVKPTVHLRRLLQLAGMYGRLQVLDAIRLALEYQTYDAAYVETILLQQRRRHQLPSPMPLCPKRRELIEEIGLEEPDPAEYDRLFGSSETEAP